MNVYLLPGRKSGCFLYAEGLEDESGSKPSTETEPVAGFRRFLDGAHKAFRGATRRRREKELLLASLAADEDIRLHYPSSWTEDKAREQYDGLLQDEVKKHKTWMVVDAAALPVSVPLSLIPGPNVLLGYLAWRSVRHYKSKKAGEQAREIDIDFVPSQKLSELDDLVRQRFAFHRKKRIRKLGKELGLIRLDQVY